MSGGLPFRVVDGWTVHYYGNVSTHFYADNARAMAAIEARGEFFTPTVNAARVLMFDDGRVFTLGAEVIAETP